jgi:hypothetical protein
MTIGKVNKTQQMIQNSKENVYSFQELTQLEQYKTSIKKLQEKCRKIQKENEFLVFR